MTFTNDYTPPRDITQGHLTDAQLAGLQKGWEAAKAKKLPPKPCLICGNDVHPKPSTWDRAKYCSVECKHVGQRGSPGNKTKSGPFLHCETCGQEFYINKNRATRRRFCSLECKHVGMRGVERSDKGQSKLRKGTYINCKVCGKETYVQKSKIGRKKYCSYDCMYEDRKSNMARESSWLWNGGRVNQGGYIYVKDHSHPKRNSQNYIAEHRLVIEKELGRYLEPTELVHHKNGVKTDNRIENLEVVQTNTHYGVVECPHCGKEFLIK